MDKRCLPFVLFLALVLAACTGARADEALWNRPPPFESVSFVVPAGSTYQWTFGNVRSGGTIEGSFTTVGGNGDVTFQVKSPAGKFLANMARVAGTYRFRYVVSETGAYVLVFDNSFSVFTDKRVSLTYRAY